MTMNAHEVIALYVADVAAQLPRRQRNDVAFELHALLDEELQARAEAEGRAPDAAMATALLQAFGRPAEVAARYRPTLTVIDPVDGRAFVTATWIGLALIWGLGLLVHLPWPIVSGDALLLGLARWWTGTVLPSPWWPGVLVIGFAIAAWVRRRWPQTADWTPRDVDRIKGGRGTLVLGMLGIVAGTLVLVFPLWFFEAIFGTPLAPALRESFTYTERVRVGPWPWLIVLLLYVPLFAAVLVRGRWSPLLRRTETVLGLAISALMLWLALAGPVFVGEASDRTLRFFLVAITAVTLAYQAFELYRSVKPAPDARRRSQ